MNFVKFLRTPFLTEHLGGCFCTFYTDLRLLVGLRFGKRLFCQICKLVIVLLKVTLMYLSFIYKNPIILSQRYYIDRAVGSFFMVGGAE